MIAWNTLYADIFNAEYQEMAQKERETIEQEEPLTVDTLAGESLEQCPDASTIGIELNVDVESEGLAEMPKVTDNQIADADNDTSTAFDVKKPPSAFTRG